MGEPNFRKWRLFGRSNLRLEVRWVFFSPFWACRWSYWGLIFRHCFFTSAKNIFGSIVNEIQKFCFCNYNGLEQDGALVLIVGSASGSGSGPGFPPRYARTCPWKRTRGTNPMPFCFVRQNHRTCFPQKCKYDRCGLDWTLFFSLRTEENSGWPRRTISSKGSSKLEEQITHQPPAIS